MDGKRESGQSTVEWVGLLLVVALIFTAALRLGAADPSISVARNFTHAVLCAVGVDGRCPEQTVLNDEYGEEVAELLRDHAPSLVFEDGASWLPIDFRECGDPDCDEQWKSINGSSPYQPGAESVASAFTRVVDCRDKGAVGKGVSVGGEHGGSSTIRCDGDREGNLYLTYWLYYPESSSFDGVPLLEERGYHAHDWESFQVRVGPDGTSSRASSHRGYNYRKTLANWPSDAGFDGINQVLQDVGWRPEGGWGKHTGRMHVTAGSQAGNITDNEPGNITDNEAGSITDGEGAGAMIEASDLRLYPLEPIAREPGSLTSFSPITPPWEKAVWLDPESTHTG